jgi:ATP-dependent helicase IRC3
MPYWDRKRKAPCRIVLSDDESDTEEAASMIAKQSPSDPSTSKSVLKLRTYQEDAVHAVLQALKDGLTRVGVSAPTASGKTVIFMALMPLVPVPKHRENAEKILILTNSVTLCHQTRKEVLKTYGKKYNVGLQQGESTVTEYDDV